MTYAKVIADSIHEHTRLTTLEVRFHRFVLAEFNTHRAFSRNSASSRAIPVSRQLDRVTSDPALPVSWPRELAGMQGGAELDVDQVEYLQWIWTDAATRAADVAAELHRQGLHKSVTNRLLEPFMWHTVVVTSTAWENFLAQRCSPLAQPEIRVAAEAMAQAMAESTPEKLEPGEWHLPYVWEEDYDALVDLDEVRFEMAAEISAARCARVSYLTQDGKRDVRADLALYQRLVTAEPAHWSPLEHVATPWPENRQPTTPGFGFTDASGEHRTIRTRHLPSVGNLLGWRSLRTQVEAGREAVTFR